MKYSQFCHLMLPTCEEHADLAINRTPVYTQYDSQSNNQYKRANQELKGFVHQKLLKEIGSMLQMALSC